MKNNVRINDHICPFLGWLDDPLTSHAFPSNQNYCHRAKPAESPGFEHQTSFCLVPNHAQCPVALQDHPGPLPVELRVTEGEGYQSKKKPVIRITFIFLLVIVLGLLGWLGFERGVFMAWVKGVPGTETAPAITSSQNDETPIYQPTLGISATPPSAALTNTPTIVRSTPQPVPTIDTATPTVSPHGLDVPIGNEIQFVIHRIQSGESLFSFVRQYNTTVEAIRAVNYYLPSPLWVDWLVIIPVGITDTQGLPAFEAYMVTDQVTIEELAQKLSVSPEVLRYYNAVEGGYRLTPGEWLLIPKNSATP